MLKKFVQQGRSEQRGEAYLRYVEPLNETRTTLADFFSILLETRGMVVYYTASKWGASSVGRALRSQRRGRGFNSPALHQYPEQLRKVEPPTGGFEGGVPPSWGACEGAGPLSRSGEACLRAEPATEGGSTPLPSTSLR